MKTALHWDRTRALRGNEKRYSATNLIQEMIFKNSFNGYLAMGLGSLLYSVKDVVIINTSPRQFRTGIVLRVEFVTPGA